MSNGPLAKPHKTEGRKAHHVWGARQPDLALALANLLRGPAGMAVAGTSIHRPFTLLLLLTLSVDKGAHTACSSPDTLFTSLAPAPETVNMPWAIKAKSLKTSTAHLATEAWPVARQPQCLQAHRWLCVHESTHPGGVKHKGSKCPVVEVRIRLLSTWWSMHLLDSAGGHAYWISCTTFATMCRTTTQTRMQRWSRADLKHWN